jgi:hypothetical protein
MNGRIARSTSQKRPFMAGIAKRVTITRERLPHTSTGRFLDKLADFFFDGGVESVHGKRGRPKVTVIEVRVLLETERRVP